MNFFARALLEISLLGLLSAVAGTLIVLRKRAFFAVALSHATFPGGVLFALLGWQVLAGQALAALLLVLLLAALSRVQGLGKQAASGVVLSLGFALGTVLANYGSGINVPVEALLVGSPLAIETSDLVATAAVLVVSFVALALVWRPVMFFSFDPAGARVVGYSAARLELVTSALIALAVIVAMPAVGAILGVSILIAPAAAARLLVREVRHLPWLAAVLGVLGGVVGLLISLRFDVAAGGAVGLTLTAVYLLALAVARLRGARSRTRGRAAAPRS